jgi:hypothetical protein
MKKILAFIILSIAVVSCYEGYIKDYVYDSVYFPYQIDVRTFVVGEGMKVEVGADLGGVRKNTRDRDVSFIFDPTLLAPALAQMKIAAQPHIKGPTTPVTTLLRLPGSYFTITDSTTFIIKSGQHMGSVVIKPDSTKFLNDSVRTVVSTFALPFYITNADADTILKFKRSNVVGFKFENMLFGNYWHGGVAVIQRAGKPDSTVTYKTTIPTAEANIWVLTTRGPNTLVTNGYANVMTAGAKDELKIVFKNGKIYVSAGATASFPFAASGTSKYNGAKLLQDRRIVLKYTYQRTIATVVHTYVCTDTLTFRNRLRDGVNEWMDENPSHYTK